MILAEEAAMRDLIRSFFSWITDGASSVGSAYEPPDFKFQERFQSAGGDGTLNFAAETAEGSCNGQTPAIRVEVALHTFVRLDVLPNDRGRPSCSLMLPAPPGRILCVQELEGGAAGHVRRFSFPACVRGPGDMLRRLEERVTSFVGDAEESAGLQRRVVTRVSATLEHVKPMPIAAVGVLAGRAAEETMRGEIELDEAEEERCDACSAVLVREEWLRVVALGCGHVFHVGCIYDWLRREHSCALCRSRKLPRSEADASKDAAAVGRVTARRGWFDGALRQMDWKICGADDDDNEDERPKGLRPFGFCGGSSRALPQDYC